MMTKNQIQTAINEGNPFRSRMADGQQYDVSDRYQIALGLTSVVVVDPEGVAHVLPLPTLTGLSYLRGKK